MTQSDLMQVQANCLRNQVFTLIEPVLQQASAINEWEQHLQVQLQSVQLIADVEEFIETFRFNAAQCPHSITNGSGEGQ